MVEMEMSQGEAPVLRTGFREFISHVQVPGALV